MENLLHTFFRARRAAKEAKEAPAQPAPAKVKVEVKKFVKIGRPGYKGMQALVFYMVVTLWFIILVSLKNALLKKINVFFSFFFLFFIIHSDQTEGSRDGTAIFTFPGLYILKECT